VQARVRSALEGLDALLHVNGEERAEGGVTVAVLHKGIIKLVLEALLGRPDASTAFSVSLGGIYHLIRVDDCWRLRAENHTAHLGELDLGG
jgi:broad specificity phosphatase PhoE